MKYGGCVCKLRVAAAVAEVAAVGGGGGGGTSSSPLDHFSIQNKGVSPATTRENCFLFLLLFLPLLDSENFEQKLGEQHAQALLLLPPAATTSTSATTTTTTTNATTTTTITTTPIHIRHEATTARCRHNKNASASRCG
jgi:hypothetical protein